MTYQYPNSTDSQGIYELFAYINTQSDGIFFPVMLLVIDIIVLVTLLSKTSPAKAFTFAAFMSTIIGMIMAVLDLLSPTYMYLSLVVLGISVFWMSLENG